MITLEGIPVTAVVVGAHPVRRRTKRLLPRLTRREIEILQLVAEGRTNREVAKLLWVTDQTVKFHLANTYRKLGVRNRFEASEWAAVRGLVRDVAEHPSQAA